jgi:putative ABC transport system permease protein
MTVGVGALGRLRGRDLIGVGWHGLGMRRLRTMLTTVGIAIGIAAIVAVVGVSESSRANLLAELDRLGTNLLTVSAGQTLLGADSSLPTEASGMVERIGPVEAVSGTTVVDATVRRSDLVPSSQTGGIGVFAAETDLDETLGLTLADGAFLNDATAQYPAVVLGAVAADRLGITSLHDEPVLIWIGNRWFSVIGILEPNALAPELDRAAIIGSAAATELFDTPTTFDTLYVRTTPQAIDDVRLVLGPTANPANPEEVRVARPSDALEARAAADTAFTALLIGLGMLALFVAGVGIANVMLMSVLERRIEIGLRRALGATRRHIAGQFLVEALLLAGLGGVTGAVLGAGFAAIFARAQGWPLVLPVAGIAAAMGAALLIGAIAGIYPARQAARVSPTQALHAS